MNYKIKINNEIRFITQLLVKKSISISQNWPSEQDEKIVWAGYRGLAFSLQNEPYEDIYEKCKDEKDYNFMLIDGSLIQLQYEFNRGNVIGHILSFLPNPSYEKYQDNPEEFEILYYGNELFTSILEKRTIVFPIRFDYSQTHNNIHPKIHATFGNYKDCRIPISKPIGPKMFISFILRNFYNFKFIETGIEKSLVSELTFAVNITQEEQKILHFTYT